MGRVCLQSHTLRNTNRGPGSQQEGSVDTGGVTRGLLCWICDRSWLSSLLLVGEKQFGLGTLTSCPEITTRWFW